MYGTAVPVPAEKTETTRHFIKPEAPNATPEIVNQNYIKRI